MIPHRIVQRTRLPRTINHPQPHGSIHCSSHRWNKTEKSNQQQDFQQQQNRHQEEQQFSRLVDDMARMWREGWQLASPYLAKSYGAVLACCAAGAIAGKSLIVQ
jgi:hypothetical protein